MTKKEFIINVFEKISTNRPLGKVIYILLKEDKENTMLLDKVIPIIQNFVDSTVETEAKEILKKGLSLMQKIHNEELVDDKINKQELKEIELLINSI